MDKLKMHTPDLAEENFRKLAELFPNALTETVDGEGRVVRAIDADVLRQEISAQVVEGPQERYQFTWPDKRQAALTANTPVSKTLRPCRAESAGRDGAPGGFDSENLYIEGDNLEVLKLLRETYLGKIKMIYIDPPYNTGNDFVYKDNFAMRADAYIARSGQLDENGSRLVLNLERSGRFHTDWLNMMYPRLKLARDLLSDLGVILINMDESEIDNLQKLCAEVFGRSNDLGTIIWDKRNPKGDAKGISCQHEYILVYAKNRAAFTEVHNVQRPKKNAAAILKKAKQLFSRVSDGYTLEDANADFAEWLKAQTDFSGGERAYNRIDEQGEVYRAVSMAWPNKKRAPDDYFLPLVHPVTGQPCRVPERGWRNSPAKMKHLLESGRILFGRDETTVPNSKYFLRENLYENIPSLLYYGGSDTDMLSQMGIPFDTPKAVNVCAEHIASFTDRDDIVLDFFSGSATTAHAVMQLNAQDGGRRKFIMVQWAEETAENSEARKAGYQNICELGKERIRRAGAKIKADNPSAARGLDVGFRVLKCDSSNMKPVYYTPANTDQAQLDLLADNIKEDRTPEDLLFQVMLDLGIPLSSAISVTEMAGKQVFAVGGNVLLACFDRDVAEETITEAAKRKPACFAMRDSSMADDAVAANIEQIFTAYSPHTAIRVL